MNNNEQNNINNNFPFLTCIEYQDNKHLGIVQNVDDKIICFYDINRLHSNNEKELLLEYGEIWWWESNRQIPINIFFHGVMKCFSHALVTLNINDITINFGPTVSLTQLLKKRIKRKQIQLIRRTD